MTTEELLSQISSFFEIQQGHFSVSYATVQTNVQIDQLAFEAEVEAARREKLERDEGEGEYPLTTDPGTVLSELDNCLEQISTSDVYDSNGDEVDEAAANNVIDEVMEATTQLQPHVSRALFWGTGYAEESKYFFSIYTKDNCEFSLSFGFD